MNQTTQGIVLDQNMSFATTDKKITSFKDISARYLVLYFYPKDNTPGCTNEAKDFTKYYEAFKQLDTEVVGVSRDSISKHENFKERYDIPYPLLSDADEAVCKHFDVIKQKNFMGRSYLGIDRSTFILDSKGHCIKEWRSVKVKGHVEAVLNFLQTPQ